MFVLTFLLEHLIRCYVVNGQEETWTASIASYLGGIIGGIASGVFAFLGVFYTIRYYKESDAQKERTTIQPFLLVQETKDPWYELPERFSLGKDSEEKDAQKEVCISIQNIGHGFANTLAIHTGVNIGGISFNKVILVGEHVYTLFIVNPIELKEGVSFSLQYIDSMTNEYIQDYSIKEGSNRIEIECGYPQLLEY